MKIPFCLPLIDEDVINEVNDALTNTGWLTTGPKARALEGEIAKYTGVERVLCVNSWTSGAMLILKWYGIGLGDEVIIPAYTYSATALCAMNLGAKVVMVDVNDDFNINVENIKAAITKNTKAIIPVDIGGWPCDYEEIMSFVDSENVRSVFEPSNERQKALGRPIVLSDAAHSLGAVYKGVKSGNWIDFTIFSLHSVKNVTAGEGGAICINLPDCFDGDAEYKFLRAFALNGQTKSAFEKNQLGSWRYDIIDQGLKINMPDICAAIALAQIRKYESTMLPERKTIFDYYNNRLKKYDWTILPLFKNDNKESSCHLYLLRIKGITEAQRDEMIQFISSKGVGVNVHYIPMAMLTLFKNKGYDISDYPNTYDLYHNLITLPVYNGLDKEKLDFVIDTVIESYQHINQCSTLVQKNL
jgi:dTDP-4-amino-4,6-dideoxygalactose transaminase